MGHISVADAKNRFSDLLRRAEYAGERLVVHRHGKPVAAIISTEDLRRLEALEDAEDIADARAALREAEKLGTVPLETALKKYGLEHMLAKTPGGQRPRASHRRANVKALGCLSTR